MNLRDKELWLETHGSMRKIYPNKNHTRRPMVFWCSNAGKYNNMGIDDTMDDAVANMFDKVKNALYDRI